MRDFYDKITERIVEWNKGEWKIPKIDYSKISKKYFKIIHYDESYKLTLSIPTDKKIEKSFHLGDYMFDPRMKLAFGTKDFIVEFARIFFYPSERLFKGHIYYWFEIYIYSRKENGKFNLDGYPILRKDKKLLCCIQVIPEFVLDLIHSISNNIPHSGMGSRRYRQSIFGQYKNRIIINKKTEPEYIKLQLNFITLKQKIDVDKKNFNSIKSYIRAKVNKGKLDNENDLDSITDESLTYIIAKIKDAYSPYSFGSYIIKIIKSFTSRHLRDKYDAVNLAEASTSFNSKANKNFPLSIFDITKILDMNERNIYRLIEQNKLEPINDGEYIKLDENSFNKLNEIIGEKKKIELLKYYIAEKNDIKPKSARDFIRRRMNKGQTLKGIAVDMGLGKFS